MCQTTVMFGGIEKKCTAVYKSLTCCSTVHAMTVATEFENVWTKFENVRAKLIVYGHYVFTLVNPYFKLWIVSSSSLINCKTIIITMAERGTKLDFKSLILIMWFTETQTLNLLSDYQQVWQSINRPRLSLCSRLSACLLRREALHAICLRFCLGAQPSAKK
jgi:hypothetical protein